MSEQGSCQKLKEYVYLASCRASHWDKLYLIVLLAITTGARKGELTKLRWNDIDFERRTAYVSTTKNGQPKVLPLTEFCD